MKGTLFSADFIKDRDGELRLLELNTDTAFTSGALAHVDFTGIIDSIHSSSASEVHVVYKDFYHTNFVNEFSKSIADSDLSVSFTKHEEDLNTIYPTSIADSSARFILRCAYDESAIFDSVYCRQKDAIFKEFFRNQDTGSVAEFYLSSSGEFFNNLHIGSNSDTQPDYLVKDISETHNTLNFYKIKGTGSLEENVNLFVDSLPEDSLVINYYEDSSETYHKAVRSFNVILGSDLDIVNLADVEVQAVLEKPSSISFDNNVVANQLDEKHYYEFTSNYPKFKATEFQGGIFEDTTITDQSNNPIAISATIEGNTYKSLLISGSPNTDNPSEYNDWFYSGTTFPPTTPTSSILVSKVEYDLTNKLIAHITTASGSDFRVNPVQTVVVYDGEDNGFRYKSIFDIDTSLDKLVKQDSSLVEISSSIFEVLEGDDHKVYVLDMEETDAFLLHDSEININLVSHNACFPAGTRILSEDGNYIAIEDIKEGNKVRTFNVDTKEFESGIVGSLKSSSQNKLISIVTNAGNSIKSTPGHMFFTLDGWKIAARLKEGDKLLNSIGEEVEIVQLSELSGEFTVYHILNVESNYNYFAEDLLVHNVSFRSCFVAGTLISMADGSSKPIEQVKIGDEVISFNESTKENEIKKVLSTNSPVHNDIVTYELQNGETLSCTFDHPIYSSNLDLFSFRPAKTNSTYDIDSVVKEVNTGTKVLDIDSNSVEITNISSNEDENVQTYIFTVEDNHNFYANGILVHNK